MIISSPIFDICTEEMLLMKMAIQSILFLELRDIFRGFKGLFVSYMSNMCTNMKYKQKDVQRFAEDNVLNQADIQRSEDRVSKFLPECGSWIVYFWGDPS